MCGGGGSGGGAILIFYGDSFTNTGTISTTGGAGGTVTAGYAGGAGGDGSKIITKVKTAEITYIHKPLIVQDGILCELPKTHKMTCSFGV